MPRSAGHRPGRMAMAAGRRAGRGGPQAGGRLSAPQPRAPAPGALGAHASGLPGGRLRGARGAWLPWAPGAQQCSRGGAQSQPRRARSQPPSGARSRGAGRRAPQNPDWNIGAGRWQGGAEEERRGRAPSRYACGPQPAPGIPLGEALGSSGEGLGWWAGRPPTAPRGLLRQGQESETRSGSVLGSGLSRARQPAHRWLGRGAGLQRPRSSASLQRAARGRGARGRFHCSPLPPPPPLRLPAALRGRQRAAVRLHARLG